MRCGWCSASLVDADGNPAWDVFTHTLPSAAQPGELVFVCVEGCGTGVVRRAHVPSPQRIRSRMLARAGGRRG